MSALLKPITVEGSQVMTYYALKEKGLFVFSCAAQTPKEHEEKVQRAYWQWRGIQPRGTAASIDEFMTGYEQVKVTLEPYNA